MDDFIKNIDLDIANKTFTLHLEDNSCGKTKLDGVIVSVNKIVFTEPTFKDKLALEKLSVILDGYTKKYSNHIAESWKKDDYNEEVLQILVHHQKKDEKIENKEPYSELDTRVYLSRIVSDILKLNIDAEHNQKMIILRNYVISKCQIFADNNQIYTNFDEVFSNEDDMWGLDKFKDELSCYFLGFFFNVLLYSFPTLMKNNHKSCQY